MRTASSYKATDLSVRRAVPYSTQWVSAGFWWTVSCVSSVNSAGSLPQSPCPCPDIAIIQPSLYALEGRLSSKTQRIIWYDRRKKLIHQTNCQIKKKPPAFVRSPDDVEIMKTRYDDVGAAAELVGSDSPDPSALTQSRFLKIALMPDWHKFKASPNVCCCQRADRSYHQARCSHADHKLMVKY